MARLARPGVWEGGAAEAYAAGLDELPRDLQRCGDAFLDLAGALERYHDRFVDARREAQELERRAAEARATLDVACDSAATEKLGAILREASDFAERFDESVDDIAAAIRRLAASAPDQPLFDRLRHWAAAVVGLSLTHHPGEPADALRFYSTAAYPSAAERARAVQAWARGMTDAQWDALITASPELVGRDPLRPPLPGQPGADRAFPGRDPHHAGRGPQPA